MEIRKEAESNSTGGGEGGALKNMSTHNAVHPSVNRAEMRPYELETKQANEGEDTCPCDLTGRIWQHEN